MKFKVTVGAIALTISLLCPSLSEAATYKVKDFIITIGDDGSYQGCDARNKCIKIQDGTSWRDNGYRGKTWENGEYGYQISWQENSGGPMFLSIFKGNQRIFRSEMVPYEGKVASKVATFCNVQNIKQGYLALRTSPGGQSRAGLSNGDQTILRQRQGIWANISVIQASNSKLDNLVGWVNSNYLSCFNETID